MCGLVSIISKQKNGIYNQDLKIFTEMLFADQVRGADGTGIIFNLGKDIRTFKAALPAAEFIALKEYEKAGTSIVQRGNFVVGHNRSATKGSLTAANSHPFREKHITLVHNGTLSSHKNIANTDVDSHAICISIAEKGYKHTLKTIDGAFALIWVDNKQKTINFIRNVQRPLWIIETPFLWIIASEHELARWICGRNNMTITEVKEVPVGVLHQFNIGEYDKYYTENVAFKQYIPNFMGQENYHGYKQQTSSIVPFNQTALEDKTKDSFPQIGMEILFIPTGIDKEMPTKIIGEWENQKTGETVEIRYWAANKIIANELVKAEQLKGRVTHIAYMPATKSHYFSVSSAYAIKQKKIVATSKNNIKLTQEDLATIKPKCTCCDGHFNKALINMCDVEEDIYGKLSATCPDCTAWLDKKEELFEQCYK